MLLLAAIAAANPAPAGAVDRGSLVAQATATVRIEHAVSINADQWQRTSPGERRETIIRDQSGQPIILRLVEMP